MPVFKPKKCAVDKCDNVFVPKGPASKFCHTCSSKRIRESAKRRTMDYRIKHGITKKPYSGKGGNNAKGEEDSQYKTGISSFQCVKRYNLKRDKGMCNRCESDLSNASRYMWCVHHIDHDRTNNEYSNLELLCKRCHQIEHDCHNAFTRAETIETTL